MILHHSTPARGVGCPRRRPLARSLRLLGALILLAGIWGVAGHLLRPGIARADEGRPPAPTQTVNPGSHGGAHHPEATATPVGTGTPEGSHSQSGATDSGPEPHNHPASGDHGAGTGAPAGDEGGHGHGEETSALSAWTKSAVLGGFAGTNGLVLITAAVLRRRNPPRLPKHLQR